MLRAFIAVCRKCGKRSKSMEMLAKAAIRELETIGWAFPHTDKHARETGALTTEVCPACNDNMQPGRTVQVMVSFLETVRYNVPVYLRLNNVVQDKDVYDLINDDGFWFELVETQCPDFITTGSVEERELSIGTQILDSDVADEGYCKVCGEINAGNTCCPPEDK